jgi:ribosomal protein S18 acetylase RimI-like enzyme
MRKTRHADLCVSTRSLYATITRTAHGLDERNLSIVVTTVSPNPLPVVDSHTTGFLRPVNLKTDLAALADLIELAFSNTMDNGGRAAIREMRALSKISSGLNLIGGINDLVVGLGMGYVWIEDNTLVGNVSIYPASLPADEPPTFIIANVATHPAYRGRKIARTLMQASMDSIRARATRQNHAPNAILQVEHDNEVAKRLYHTFGFREQGTFSQWKRSATYRQVPPLASPTPYMTRRGKSDWKSEMALAAIMRPNERGGIGWLRPLHRRFFSPTLWQSLGDFFSLRGTEHLIIRGENGDVRSAMWIERAFGASTVQLTLMCSPDYEGLDGEALLYNAIRRYGKSDAITIEHPRDDGVIAALLRRFLFMDQRNLTHMRWTE